MWKLVVAVALIALSWPSNPVMGQTVSLEIPKLTTGAAGGEVTIPVFLNVTDSVPALQFSIDYDNMVTTYQSVEAGSATDPNSTSLFVNPNPPVATDSPGTNASVLIQVWLGTQHKISGQNLEVARVTFAIASGVCDTSPLTFDPNCTPNTQVVIGSDVACFPQLQLHSGQLATDCATDVPSAASNGLQLLQNYPNPFNPSTTIRFKTPYSSHVRLIVIDVVGRKVRTLLDQRLPDGWHSVSWNGQDDSGGKVAGGVYYYRLTSNDKVEVREMVLVK